MLLKTLQLLLLAVGASYAPLSPPSLFSCSTRYLPSFRGLEHFRFSGLFQGVANFCLSASDVLLWRLEFGGQGGWGGGVGGRGWLITFMSQLL